MKSDNENETDQESQMTAKCMVDEVVAKTNATPSFPDSPVPSTASTDGVLHADKELDGNESTPDVNVSSFKRRKIHMDTVDCFQHADSEDGKKPLTNPSLQSLQLRRNLHPIPRKRRNNGEIKVKEEPGASVGNPYTKGFTTGSQGFVSAADMYKIANKTNITASAASSSFDKGKGKMMGKNRNNQNQSSILSFMTAKCKTESKEFVSNSSSSVTGIKKKEMSSPTKQQTETLSNIKSRSLFGQVSPSSIGRNKISSAGSPQETNSQNTRCVMHSPIKCVGTSNVIYISDNSSSRSPCSSQGSTFSTRDSSLTARNTQNLQDKSVCAGSSQSKNSPSSTMYSPIKSVGKSNTIFISDSSPSSSQGSSQGSFPRMSNIFDNPVVKQLFNAQKNIDKVKGKRKGAKQQKVSQKSKVIISKKELSNIKTEAVKYFENDSFDMDAVFASDTEFTPERKNLLKKGTSCVVNDKYGLLGTGNYPKSSPAENLSGINYFEMLPPEVMEHIFCGLPMLDLCLNSNRVCTQWNEIIANEKFLPWKKRYHKLKKDIGRCRQDVQALMNKNGMSSASAFLVGLIRYMKEFKPVTAVNMLECLQKHSRYKWAKDLIHERLPDCLVNGDPSPWCVITILVIVSDDIYCIQEIIRCLTVAMSQCTATEIVECLYCVATFLYAFKLAKRADIWNGMHYRLFYALYLYENASSASVADLHSVMSSSKGQQSLVKYSSSSESVRLTHEQLRIVKHQTSPCEVIKIVAFAGTGKTTTLVKYTQLRPDKKFLLVVYNKSVCEYSKTKFPANVTCKTGHALAFAVYGRRYISKLHGIKVYTLSQTLTARKGENLFIQAKNVLSTLENYFASADDQITTQHVPSSRVDDKTGRVIPIDERSKMLYVQDALYIWKRMQDFNEKKLGMSHDGYLKLYQLSRPSLRQYDCLLIDEAQDLTPAITDILLRQPQGKILVGDPHQQIYSFRGAINAMDTIRADTIFYLTQSFRFGPEIAQVAAHCLEILKQEKKKTLVGSGKKCSVMGEKVGQMAIISRCNFTVFAEAVKKCCYSDEPCKVAFVGGTANFGFPMMMDMYALTLSKEDREKDGYEVQHKLIKMFSTFVDLENFATKSLDKELLGKIKIVKTYHHNLPLLVRKIESKCVRDERQADYVFSTAHKAKGLEFSTVRVTDDFLNEFQPSPTLHFDEFGEIDVEISAPKIQLGDNNMDEGNLLYVAVTRAKNALQMSSTLLRLLNQAGEKFEFPVYSEDLRLAGKTFKCKETAQEFKPMTLTLERKNVQRGDGVECPSGLYSPAFLSEDFGSFAGLLGLTEDTKKSDAQRKKCLT